MPPLPVLSGAALIQLLEQVGYVQVRQRGSHVRLTCPGRTPITVPMHKEIDRGTLRSILREAEIDPADLVALMAN